MNLHAGVGPSGSTPGVAAGTITMANGATIDTGTGNFEAIGQGAVQLAGLTVGGTATVNSNGGNITQASALAVTGTSSFSAGAGSITLANGSNDFGGAVALTKTGTGSVSLTDDTALVLGNVSVGTGALTITTSGGQISQLGGTSIVQQSGATGTASFTAGAAVINLGSATNNLRGPIDLSNSGANNVTLNNSGNTTGTVLGPGH